MILTDEQIERAMDHIASSLLSRELTDKQVVERLRNEVNRIEAELKYPNGKPN